VPAFHWLYGRSRWRCQPPIQSLTIEPAKIILHGANRHQQLLVTATGLNGQPFDVTRDCTLTLADAVVPRLWGPFYMPAMTAPRN